MCVGIFCVSIAMQLHKTKLLMSNYITYRQFLINRRFKQMLLDKVQNCPQGCNYGMDMNCFISDALIRKVYIYLSKKYNNNQ